MKPDSSQAAYRIRAATRADGGVIARHRVAMFRDMGTLAERDVAALTAASVTYLEDALARGTYLGWLVECEGEVVAGAGLLVSPGLPRPENLGGDEEAYLLNIYTEPAHRRRGVARMLTERILAWCRARRIALVSLHASDAGRSLYESLGFGATNEMRLVL